MFENNASLQKFLKNGDIRNLCVGQENDLINMCLFIAYSGSAISLSGDALKNIILDEAAKHLDRVGNEADSISLARDRLTTFSDESKLFALSSPILAGDMFDREYKNTDQRKWWVKCCFCQQRHVMRWENVKLDRNSIGNFYPAADYLSGKCAQYICPACEKGWEEWDRWKAVKAGVWAPNDCKVDPDGRIIGKVFHNPLRGHHVSALMLYPGFLTIATLAADWVKADLAWKAGDKAKKQNFINSRMGESWEEKEKETSIDKIKLHIGSHKQDTIPAGVQMLTAGIDVQLDHLYVLIEGWGYLSESWLIMATRLETGDTRLIENYRSLEELLAKTWITDDGLYKLFINRAAIDMRFRGDVIVDLCKKCRTGNLIPIMGDATVTKALYRASKIAGGTITRYDLNTNALKDRVFRQLFETAASGPGYMHLSGDIMPDVIEQLAAEHQVLVRNRRTKKQELVWIPKEDHKPNHYLDCKVYSTAAAEIAGVRTLQSLEEIQPAESRKVGVMNRYQK